MKKAIHFSSWARTFTQFRMELLSSLQGLNIENIIVCSHESPHSEYIKSKGFCIHERNLSKKIDANIFASIMFLRRLLRKYRPDLLILHQPIALVVGVFATTFIDIKILYFTGGLKTHDSMGKINRWVHSEIEKVFLSKCEAIFSVNREDVNYLRRKKVKSQAYYVGPRGGCGINTDKFQSNQEERKIIREKLGIPASSIVIGMVGRIEIEKGIFAIYEEFQRLAKSNENIHFLIIGIGSQSTQLEKLISSLNQNIKQRIHYVGRQEDVNRWYSAIDVFILASKREGMPTSLLEAMSCSCLVMSTNVRGAREVIEDGSNGFLYNNIQMLTRDLDYIIHVYPSSNSIRENARSTVLNNYGEHILLPRTIRLLNKYF